MFINACRLLSALPSLSQFGQGRLSLVAISFYVLSLLFGPCPLLEFTLAGPHKGILNRIYCCHGNFALQENDHNLFISDWALSTSDDCCSIC